MLLQCSPRSLNAALYSFRAPFKAAMPPFNDGNGTQRPPARGIYIYSTLPFRMGPVREIGLVNVTKGL
jgi:hypothetical protein